MKIGRQTYFGVGKESVARGTKASATDWYKPTSIDVSEVLEHAPDNSALGVLSEVHDGRKVKSMTQVDIEGNIGDNLIGHLLMGILGTSASPSLLETGVYEHVITESNVNTKPSYSLYVKDTDQAQVALFGMVNTLELNLVAGALGKYKAQFLGQGLSDQSSTPAVASEYSLDTHDLALEYAVNLAGLGAGSSFNVKEFNLLFESNVEAEMVNGSIEPNALYNQTLKISGDFTMNWADDTFRDFVTGDTKKALRLHLENTDTLIGATEYPSLTIDLAKVGFTNIEYSRGLDELVTTKISFVGEYSISDSKTLTTSLVNSDSTQY